MKSKITMMFGAAAIVATLAGCATSGGGYYGGQPQPYPPQNQPYPPQGQSYPQQPAPIRLNRSRFAESRQSRRIQLFPPPIRHPL